MDAFLGHYTVFLIKRIPGCVIQQCAVCHLDIFYMEVSVHTVASNCVWQDVSVLCIRRQSTETCRSNSLLIYWLQLKEVYL